MRFFRNASLRTKITALLLSLFALWFFAAWVTGRDSWNLLGVKTIDQKVTRPALTMVTALQQERRLSMTFLGRPGAVQRQALDAQRRRVDVAEKAFRTKASGWDVDLFAESRLKGRITDIGNALDSLPASRQALDSLMPSRQVAVQVYDNIIDAVFRMYRSAGALSDQGIATDSRTLVTLTWAKEIVSREDALLSGALASGRLTNSERSQFAQWVGAQRLLHAQAAADLPSADRARYDRLIGTPTFVRWHTIEDRVMEGPRKGQRPPTTAGEWETTVQPAMVDLEKLTLTGGDELVQRATPVAIGVLVRLALAGGLGLIAVIASIVVSITTARSLVRQLQRLQKAALELAEQRLPDVVERLGRGDKVDVAAEAPPLEFGEGEIGQVGRAFNTVQETALRTAVEQAELRRSFRDILLSLARRSQALIHRQLTLLLEMERREEDAKDLEDLFRVDHLATRMRRNAENLIVLSGSTPARGWRRPVPMIDVVRSAVAEVEDYTRVDMTSAMDEVSLAGRAVGDIVHLLAELIENAVSFSPPYTTALVSGRMVAHGYAVEIEDRGLGMTEELLESINDRVRSTPEFSLESSMHLGLYVVGQLAERYGVRVSLKQSSYGGTTAVVVIPRDLIIETPEEDSDGSGIGSSRSPALVARTVPRTGVITSLGDAPARVEEFGPAPSEAAAAPVDTSMDTPAQSVQALPGEATPAPLVAEQTPGGLPVRVPQTSLAPALRTDETPHADDEEEDAGRPPEEIRRSIGGLQSGTRKGRTDAAKAQRPGRPDHPDLPADDEA
jgi:signal transduction histidine kinase